MQPILVRPVGDDRYEIIAGERRWRAAQMAGLSRSVDPDPGNSRTKRRWPWR
jgi:ParB-like chromosome segregation protein Spo0J